MPPNRAPSPSLGRTSRLKVAAPLPRLFYSRHQCWGSNSSIVATDDDKKSVDLNQRDFRQRQPYLFSGHGVSQVLLTAAHSLS